MSGDLRLDGQVTDEDQQPVVGARVRLSPGERVVTTQADGAFVFENLAARRYSVSASKDDLYAGPETVRVAESTEPVILRMRMGSTLIVHVVADRSPVVGARLVLDDESVAVTDAGGVATVRGLAPHYHDGQIVADGWAPGFIGTFMAEDPGGVTERYVTLRRGARIDGTVLGPGEQPVPRARVVFWAATDGHFIDETTSDDHGAWHLDALEAGKFRIVASSDTLGPAPELAFDCDGRTPRRDVIVRVNVDGQVSGTVIDKNGKPVVNATVVAVLRGENTYKTRSDALGKFAMAGLKVGQYDVAARTNDQASPAVRVALENNKPVAVSLVTEDARIAGTVVDDNGKPVSDARVQALTTRGFPSTTPSAEAVSDGHGRFDFEALEPGEYTVTASWPDERSARDRPQGSHVHTGDTQVKLTLGTPGAITARVLLDGQPLTYYGLSFDGRGPTGIRTSDGRFTLRNVDPGSWSIELLGPGTTLKVIENVTVERGKQIELGDIAMQHGQRIAGYVRDQAGAPVAGARVIIGRGVSREESRLQQWFQADYETTTDSAGAYVFAGVDPHRSAYRSPQMSATHFKLGASLFRDVPRGDATVDLVLLGAGTIDGVVDGFRSHFAFVDAIRMDEPARSRVTVVDPAGEFHFDGVPPGEYMIALEASHGEQVTSVPATVAADRAAKVRLVMTGASVRLTVLVPWGQSETLVLAGADNGVPDAAQAARPVLVMEDRGVFENVEPGSYRVSIDGKTWTAIIVAATPALQTVEIPPHQ